MENIAPAGEVLAKRHQGKDDEQAEETAVRQFRKKHFYASVTEVAEFRAAQRAKSGPKSVPYFDITVSAVKSVSVLHASLRVDAMQARAAGRSEIEQAVLEAAREAVRWLEQYGRSGPAGPGTCCTCGRSRCGRRCTRRLTGR